MFSCMFIFFVLCFSSFTETKNLIYVPYLIPDNNHFNPDYQKHYDVNEQLCGFHFGLQGVQQSSPHKPLRQGQPGQVG